MGGETTEIAEAQWDGRRLSKRNQNLVQACSQQSFCCMAVKTLEEAENYGCDRQPAANRCSTTQPAEIYGDAMPRYGPKQIVWPPQVAVAEFDAEIVTAWAGSRRCQASVHLVDAAQVEVVATSRTKELIFLSACGLHLRMFNKSSRPTQDASSEHSLSLRSS